MSVWNKAVAPPRAPGIYRVRVPYLLTGEGFAHWNGDYWCCVANTVNRARMCYWRGPANGYDWRAL